MHITGTGIPTDSYITVIGATSITFSNIALTAASASNTGVTITGTPVCLTFDLSTLNSDFINGGKYIIDEVEIADSSAASSNGNTQLNLILFNQIPFPTTAADNTQLDLAATELAKRVTGFAKIMDPQNYKTTSLVKQVEISRKAKAELTTKLVYGLIQVVSYTPTVNSNILTPCIKGIRVN